MVKQVLPPLTALGSDQPMEVEIGQYRVTERFDIALASLATRKGQESAFAKIAKSKGLSLAGSSQSEVGKKFSSFCLASQQWMIEADVTKHDDLEAELKSHFGASASVTEQTDAWVRFDVKATHLQPLFEKLCNVDFATAPIGFASRTVIEHIGCYLIKRTVTEVTLYGPRSSAQSLIHVIEATARSL